MPNCFTLTRIGDTEPTKLTAIDEELCAMLGVPVHPTRWVYGWYDNFGLAFAMGTPMEELEELTLEYGRAGDIKILHYLRDNFTVNAWYEPKS